MSKRWITGWLILAVAVLGQSVSASEDAAGNVRDFADLLSPGLEKQIGDAFAEIDQATKSPFFLVTVPSLPSSGPGVIEGYAESLMLSQVPDPMELARSNWGHCVLFLIAAESREATFHFANKWQPDEIARARRVLHQRVRPLIAAGQFDEGAAEGAQAMLNVSRAITSRHDSYWEIFKRAELNASIQLFLSLTSASLTNPILYIAMIYGVILVLELLFPWRKDQPRNRPMLVVDIIYTMVNYVLFWGLIGTALGAVASVAFEDALFGVFATNNLVAVQLDALPVWVRMILLLLFTEFTSYWVHRLLHGSDFFWEIHKVHHSATQLDVFNAARLHILEPIAYHTLTYVPALMIGFGVGETFFVGFLTTFVCNFTHANCRIRFGPFKYIFNSPELHLWHHSQATTSRPNCNFGNLLSVWDFAFGTGYVPADPDKIPPMAFEGVEDYPTGYWSQFLAPFKGMVGVLTRRFR